MTVRRSPWLVGLAGVAVAVSQVHLARLVGAYRPNILFLQLSFSPERYWGILRAWGLEGLQAYRGHFAADWLHLCLYALFGYLLAHRGGLFVETENRASGRLAALLPLAALFDVAENLLQLRLLAGPFGAPSALIPLSAACSLLKWGLVVVFAVWTAWRLIIKFGVARRPAN